MPEKKSRFVLLCQQALVVGTVLAVAAPAASMITLDIVAPPPAGVVDGVRAGPQSASLVASEPVRPHVTEVPVDGVDPEGVDAVTDQASEEQIARDELAALSAPEPVTGYATVGVTWEQGAVVDEEDITISVRSLENGAWSGWEALEYHDDHGPDPQSAEGSTVRPGTEPIVVGDADEVQVKAVTDSGEAPRDMALAVVDPGQSAAPTMEQPAIDTAAPGAADGDASLVSADTVLSAASPARPKIYSRAQWGADERMRDPGSLRYGSISAGFVHHTVNANGYTAAQVPSLLRGIYAYHTQSRGWSDVGYNFLVDRFGRIWEGRYGGVSRPVVGAHTLGYNDYSFAMSAIGNFDIESGKPGDAMLRAYGGLFAWKLSLHGVDAGSTRQRVGSSYFRAINGHRDAGSTACPGRFLYAKLPTIRGLAADYQKGATDPEPPPPEPPKPPADPKRSADLAGSSWPDLVVRDRSSKRAFVVRTGGQLAFEPAARVGRRWDEMDLVAGSRDLTGDRVDDLLARNESTGRTGVYPGDGDGGFGAPVATTVKFTGADQLTGVRDINGDGNNDMVARDAESNALHMYRGTGDGGFLGKRLLATDWDYDLTVGVGDFDRDGRFDIAARSSEGALRLFPVSEGVLGSATGLAQGWDVFDLVAGLGDLTNDGRADIVARNAKSGFTYIYPGDGEGGLRERLGPFDEFEGLDFLTSPGQVSGDRRSDLVGRESSGRIVAFTNTGRENISAVSDTGEVWRTTNLLVNVGDWNGDGHGDVMTRSGRTGRIYLRKGDGKGHFAKPVRAATGWGSVESVSAVGDVTGDGNPDLVGRPRGEAMRTYPGDGKSGFLSTRPADSAIRSGLSAGSPDRYDWMLNVGDANGDTLPDLIAREKATGKLWLMPGTSKGFAHRRLISEAFSTYDLGG